MKTVLSLNEILAAPESLIGGKAKNLEWLQRFGHRVPPFFVLSTACFRIVLEHALQKKLELILQELAETPAAGLLQQATTLQNRIKQQGLPRELQEQLDQELDRLNHRDGFYAVRSSAVGEDSVEASFAGQMDSYLFLKTREQIYQACLDCIASAFGHRAILYRQEKGLPLQGIQSAVICQIMIESESAGVVFTAHPTTGSRRDHLISACWGLGESVVSGTCDADEFVVRWAPKPSITERKVVMKEEAIFFNKEKGFGTHSLKIDANRQNTSCLSDSQILELSTTAHAISREAGSPQDIEFGFHQGLLYILQTRPITSLPVAQEDEELAVVWDNSNIQESYCGVTTPLTFSFASRAYRFVYQNTGQVLGGKVVDSESQNAVLRNLLGLIRGRVYYNINHWYLGLSSLPSFKTNKEDMERMMGLQDPIDFIQPQERQGWDKWINGFRALGSLLRLLSKFSKISKLVPAFNQNFWNHYRAIDRSTLHHQGLMELYRLSRNLEEEVIKRWTTPIINDFYVMMMNGSVHRQLKALGIENTNLSLNNLLSGEEGIESTEPTKFLLKLCDLIRRDPLLIKAFETRKSSELMPYVQTYHQEFHKLCQEYIELYGDRTMGELKLESITLRQDPAFMFSCLKNYLDNPQLSLQTLLQQEQHLRTDESKLVFGLARKKKGPLGLWRLKKDLQRLREAVKNRENMRLARTRLFGLYRSIYLEMGHQLRLHKQLQDPRDIFYLTVEELEQFFEGRSVGPRMSELVALRKVEYHGFEEPDVPYHFWTKGSPYFGNDFERQTPKKEVFTGSVLHGIGCYPGLVEAPIRLIFSPDDELSLKGQILCTVRTDPGWAPLFPSAAGILVERGSSLSHSAVVARELGIPAIVNIPGLTQILKDGERVRMDGKTGTIERLNAP